MAKMNFDFYDDKYLYSDGDIENEIIEYVKKSTQEDYSDILSEDSRWPTHYHLTPIRQNVLSWYPFKKDCNILEIGAGMGAITPLLCNVAKSVTSVELSKTRATCIYERCKNYDNLEIIVGNLNDIKLEEKYDYITLIGVLEYAISFTDSDKPYHTFLENIKKLLKPDGKLLIAIENRFGLKYWCGASEDHTSKPFDGINGYKDVKFVKTFDRLELDGILKDCGFNYTDFYYPYPDYKLPQIIYSDRFRPNGLNVEKNEYYYDVNARLIANESELFERISKNEVDDFFANSFIIEASALENNTPKVDHAVYMDQRKNENKIITTILNNKTVVKKAYSDIGVAHIQKIKGITHTLKQRKINVLEGEISQDNSQIEYEFIDKPSLDFVVVKLLQEKKKEEAVNIINAFFEIIKKSSEKSTFEDFINKYKLEVPTQLNSLEILKEAYIDLTFFNCFYDGEFLLFDQEFEFEHLPLNFILYRGLFTLFDRNRFLNNYIDVNTLYNNFGICDEQIKLFQMMEREIVAKTLLKQDLNYRLQNRYDVAMEKINKSNDEKTSEVKTLENELKLTHQHANNLEEINKSIQTHINNIEEQNRLTQTYVQNLEEQNRLTQTHINNIEEQNKNQSHTIANLYDEIALMKKSVFWKMGNTCRKISNKIRGK